MIVPRQFVCQNRRLLGGKRVLRGTTIPISEVERLLQKGISLADLRECFPQMPREFLGWLAASGVCR